MIFTIPLYHGCEFGVLVTTDIRATLTELGYTPADNVPYETYDAVTIKIPDLVAIVFNGSEPITTTTKYHEAMHATHYVMDVHGVRPNRGDSLESWAYLQGWIGARIEEGILDYYQSKLLTTSTTAV